MTTISAEQFRIEQVQILNWGGYTGLQVMRAGRASAAILGPSGRGKSTLLDGMASVPTHASRKAVTHLPTPVDQVIAAPLMNPGPPGGRRYEGVVERPLSSWWLTVRPRA